MFGSSIHSILHQVDLLKIERARTTFSVERVDSLWQLDIHSAGNQPMTNGAVPCREPNGASFGIRLGSFEIISRRKPNNAAAKEWSSETTRADVNKYSPRCQPHIRKDS